MDIIKSYYNDPETGYKSISKFWKIIHKAHPEIQYKDVKDFFSKEEAAQITASANRDRALSKFKPIRAAHANDIWQADLTSFDKITGRFNHGHYILLNVIDV